MATDTIYAVKGVQLGSIAAGIRYPNRQDLVTIALTEGSTVAAVFTTNAFCAAPVVLARTHLAQSPTRYLLINSGNANAGTGESGMRAAQRSCATLAQHAGCAAEAVLPFSTGVIGEDLNIKAIVAALPELLNNLREDAWQQAAAAIMTTDTVPKLVSRQITINNQAMVVTGMCKGSGMIRPDMATMLAYIATDAAVPQALLQDCLQAAVAPSFNSITVDGDTSTNDACVLMATGQSGVAITDLQDEAGRLFADTVLNVCMELARMVVKDGEGATKLVEIRVSEAASLDEARQVAFTIAHSPLVKTALFASDPNWGRILAAVGRAGLENLDLNAVRIALNAVSIVANGGRDPSYTEAAGKAVMQEKDILIQVALGRGAVETSVLTCDFSYDYVKINAEYRS